jgi:hypothetical protein
MTIEAMIAMRRLIRSLISRTTRSRFMQVITKLDDLDVKLTECDAAQKISDDALREVFTTFRMDFSA